MVQVFRDALADGDWHTARELARLGLDDRTLRTILEDDPEGYVSTDKGYRRIEMATREDIAKSAARLLSQGRKMVRRGMRLQAVLLRGIRPMARVRAEENLQPTS